MSKNLLGLLKILSLVLIVVLAWALISTRKSAEIATPGVRKIYVASIVELEPIKQLRDGFKARMSEAGYASRVQYIERNAQGDAGLIAQIASEIARERPDLVYVLGTPLAQAIQKRSPETVVVQGAVTDPVEAGLAESWSGSGRKYAANSDRPPTKKIVAAIRQLVPGAKSIGFLYNPSESNSIAVLKSMKAEATKVGLDIREYSVGRTTEIPISVAAAIATADVLFVPPDNTVTSGLEVVIRMAADAKTPLFSTTTESVRAGAFAGVTSDFNTLGGEAADIAISILFEGSDPGSIPIALPKDTQLMINRAVARKLGIAIPKGMRFAYAEEL